MHNGAKLYTSGHETMATASKCSVFATVTLRKQVVVDAIVFVVSARRKHECVSFSLAPSKAAYLQDALGA
jgi:hypothetical protein